MNDNKVSNLNNQSALYDLIQSIQTKMNSNQEEKSKDNNINEKSNNNENKTENKINNLDLSSLLNNLNISSIINNCNSNNENDNSFNFSDMDPNTILKIQKLISNFSKNDPKKNLLRSLKPFLRKSRQDKIGEYITILSVIDALDIFSDKGSD